MNGNRHVNAFVVAMDRMVAPNRIIMADPQSSIVVSGGPSLDTTMIAELAEGADLLKADLIYLEFERGAAAEGPRNIIAAAVRSGVIHLAPRCAVWSDPRGRPYLIRQSGKVGMISIDPDGLAFSPGRPSTSIAKGLARGSELLQHLAAEEFARSNAFHPATYIIEAAA